MRKVIVTLALCIIMSFAAAPAVSANSFKDVPKQSSHYEGITYLTSKGIISGYTLKDGTKEYFPGIEISRTHTAVILSEALGLSAHNVDKSLDNFTDIPVIHLYAYQIASTYDAGIFKGSNGKFNEGPLTREQMATVLASAFSLTDDGKPSKIHLENVSDSHKQSVKLLAQHSITNQYNDFRPGEKVTRGQFATFLYLTIKATQGIETPEEEILEEGKPEEEKPEPEDDSLLGELVADKQLPTYATNKNLSAVHGYMNYWKWSETDEAYVDSLASEPTYDHKVKLFSELFDLQAEHDEVSEDYISIKGMKFFSSSVSGKMDSLSRAIKARYSALYDGVYEYPKPGFGGLHNRENFGFSANDENNGEFTGDKELYNALLQYPYETKGFQNLSIFAVPHHLNVAGLFRGWGYEVFITVSADDNVNTLYHELGHAFDYVYTFPESDYLSIRGNKPVSDEYYGTSYTENFAEDYRFARFPYNSRRSVITSFGNPSEEEIINLNEFYTKLENSQQPMIPRQLKLNGKSVTNSEIIIAQSDSIDFSSHGLTGDFSVQKPDGSYDRVPVNGTFTFTDDGSYLFSTPVGLFTVLYDSDKMWNGTKDSEFEEVNLTSLSGDAFYWAIDSDLAKGVFVYDQEQVLIAISSDQEGEFDLGEVLVEDGKIIIELTEGTKEHAILRAPSAYKDFPIELRNNTLQIPDDTRDGDIFHAVDYENTIYGKNIGMVLAGQVRTSTGKLYWEFTDQAGNLLQSNEMNLMAKAPHFNWFRHFVDRSEFPTGELTITFYEDSTKSVKIDEVKTTVIQ